MKSLSTIALMLVVLALTPGPSPVSCARILGLFPCPSKSHLVVFSALTRELARRGHELVVVSPFPLSKPVANYTDIDLMPSMKDFVEEISGTEMFNLGDLRTFEIPFMFWIEGLMITEYLLKHPEVKELLQDSRGFDLIIVEDFMTEALYAFSDYFKAPLVLISSLGGLHSTNYAVGNSLELAYAPVNMLTGTFTDQMTFCDRLLSVLFVTFWDLGSFVYYLPRQEALRREFFGGKTSSVWELRYSASLVLLNNHFSLNYPRPLVPAIQEVGGMQLMRTTNKLPQEIQKFLDDATEGAIYFSMGSNLRNDMMPNIEGLLSAFAELPQRVLMKWESDTMSGQPPNVKVGKWLPQQDILAHPNVRVFLTHGGLLSAQEAAYHGVPVVGIPVFGDQALNMRKAELGGYGVMVELNNVTKESILWALGRTLNEPSFRQESQRRSAVYRDQPETPLERAVFWTEYVLRHKGAPHLRSAALGLAWYQLCLLDVAAAILVTLLLAGLVLRLALRRCCCRPAATQTSRTASTKKKQ